MEEIKKTALDKKRNGSIKTNTKKFLKREVHLFPFFAGFLCSRFYEISFKNDIFLIGILLTAILIFFARDKYSEPPYNN